VFFGFSISTVYLYVFNRRTRQSLHDLVAGSIVVKAAEPARKVSVVTWRGHYVATAIILVAATTVPNFVFSDVNSRLISQSGILLQKPSKISVEDIISNFCKGNSHSPVLAKITMLSKERERVLNNLLSINISWATIYPGIDGAAMHTKRKMELLDLQVRRMGREGTALHAQKKYLICCRSD